MKSGNLARIIVKVTACAILITAVGTLNVAFAEHDSGGHSGGRGGSGSHGGSHDGGHDDGHDSGDGHDGHSGGPGGRRGVDGGRGRGHDVPGDGADNIEERVLRGRRPVWAREGIPEVELGRLNVGRAPASVLARAKDKALEEFTEAMVRLYNMTAEEAAELFRNNYDELESIHSPVQNLALYKEILTFGQTQLPGVTPASIYDLAAIFLGSASDKNIPISNDTIIAINRILGLVEMSQENTTTLANKAESVRISILAGHDGATHADP